MLSIFAISAGLLYLFGKMANDTKQGWILFAAVSALLALWSASICAAGWTRR